jgi:kynurenine formamidase
MAYRQRRSRCKPVAAALVLLLAGGVGAVDLETAPLVDLTHPFDDATIYWPTARPFRLEPVAHGHTPGGWWYAANDFCAAEHGGTHLDAPIHFAAGGWTVDEIPLDRLRGPAVVVDVTRVGAANRDALVGIRDLEADERAHGRIPDGAVVLVRTGWARRWADPRSYLGTALPADTRNLHFPGLSERAARWLATRRRVRAVGIDTASIDRGQSKDFRAHRALADANVVVFENLARLDALPPRGAVFLGLPMKIRGGSGGPLRAVALLP